MCQPGNDKAIFDLRGLLTQLKVKCQVGIIIIEHKVWVCQGGQKIGYFYKQYRPNPLYHFRGRPLTHIVKNKIYFQTLPAPTILAGWSITYLQTEVRPGPTVSTVSDTVHTVGYGKEW